MTDDAKPAHPPPWRWVPAKLHAQSESAGDSVELVDGNGAPIVYRFGVNDQTWVHVPSPIVRAVTELAPEMEARLRRIDANFSNICPDCDKTRTGGHEPGCANARDLARLDDARKVKP